MANSQHRQAAVPVADVGYTVWLYIGPSPPQALVVTLALGDELEEEANGV